MAIVIEGEKKRINWFGAIAVVLAVGLLGAAIYYLFFVKPASIETVFPLQVQSLSELALIEFDSQKTFSHPVFSLQKFIPPLSVGTTTPRVNPFMPQ